MSIRSSASITHGLAAWGMRCLALLLTSACRTTPVVPGPPPPDGGSNSRAAAPSLKPGQGAPTDFNGACGAAQDTGELTEYTVALRAKRYALGFVRVRLTPQYTADYSNVLAQVTSGTIMSGMGPLKNPDRGNALGYAIAMRDSRGKLCKGYVSSTVVEPAPPNLQDPSTGSPRARQGTTP